MPTNAYCGIIPKNRADFIIPLEGLESGIKAKK
jgi:hypothetical protein